MSTALRIFPRYPFQRSLILNYRGESFSATTKDISKGGLAFTATNELSPGDFLSLELQLMGKDYCFTGEIVVKRPLESGGWFYGISFFDLSEEEAEVIGVHHDQIQHMRIDVFLPNENSPARQAAQVKTRYSHSWLISLTQHLVSMMMSCKQQTVEGVLQSLLPKIESLKRPYLLSYMHWQFHPGSEVAADVLAGLEKMRQEATRQVAALEGVYGFTGPKRRLFLILPGPLDLSQQKALGAYIQGGELIIAYSTLFQHMNKFYEERQFLKNQGIAGKLDNLTLAEMKNEFEQSMDEFLEIVREETRLSNG